MVAGEALGSRSCGKPQRMFHHHTVLGCLPGGFFTLSGSYLLQISLTTPLPTFGASSSLSGVCQFRTSVDTRALSISPLLSSIAASVQSANNRLSSIFAGCAGGVLVGVDGPLRVPARCRSTDQFDALTARRVDCGRLGDAVNFARWDQLLVSFILRFSSSPASLS
jgi:hypothetical protein